MKLWDVHLWVYAFRPDSPFHERVHAALVSADAGLARFAGLELELIS